MPVWVKLDRGEWQHGRIHRVNKEELICEFTMHHSTRTLALETMSPQIVGIVQFKPEWDIVRKPVAASL